METQLIEKPPESLFSANVVLSVEPFLLAAYNSAEALSLLHILVVEDDENLANGIRYALEQEGWIATVAQTLSEAISLYDGNSFHLILLDVMLPDGNGFELCKKIREHSDIPIVFLTARDEEVNVVMGLESGGDDYVAKPFRVRELISRIRANIRKRSPEVLKQAVQTIRSGNIRIKPAEIRVYKNDREVFLTPTEFRILRTLMENPGVLLKREQLLQRVWDIDGEYIDDNTLSVHIRRLREKLEDKPSEPSLITTVRNIGYRWSGGKE